MSPLLTRYAWSFWIIDAIIHIILLPGDELKKVRILDYIIRMVQLVQRS
jgi:hypothetical protein